MASSPPLPLNDHISSPSKVYHPFAPFPRLLIQFPQKHYSDYRLTTVYSCSPQSILQPETQQREEERATNQTKKKQKRNPRPSFIQQIQQKWSLKQTSLRQTFPWQGQEEQVTGTIAEDDKVRQSSQRSVLEVGSESGSETKNTDVQHSSHNSKVNAFLPPWAHGTSPTKKLEDLGSIFDARENDLEKGDTFGEKVEEFLVVKDNQDENLAIHEKLGGTVEKFSNLRGQKANLRNDDAISIFQGPGAWKKESNVDSVSEEYHSFEANANMNMLSEMNQLTAIDVDGDASRDKSAFRVGKELRNVDGSSGDADSSMLPWQRGSNKDSTNRMNLRKSTELAEKLVPEPELKRLRTSALRMVERIKVGAAGVTQELVNAIHEKWKDDEVVKLKFEGPLAKNMKRTHEFLESRTGGLVIWRSGSSVVLYRGMTYTLPCVQSYRNENEASTSISETPGGIVNDITQSTKVKYTPSETATTDSIKYLNSLSDEELMELNELNHLLDDLGPRFKDWSGREPVPVDADLLPATVPEYKPPVRLLPHGIRRSLRDKEMTYYRRMARTMPPHFALGRNRQLQGLALAMVKLWEKSAIAKIAIKRGVQNTCNERMAEELKVLAGGTLVSRNKDYIVFYRGNDFLSPGIMDALVEAEKSAILHQDEEDLARQKATTFVHPNANFPRQPFVAGTLSETVAATSNWVTERSTEDIKQMMKEAAVARHASLVKFLEKKLALAKAKIGKAEKTLLKLQENLSPAELPTDLETLSNEERFLFRKIGLSMKPYLELGRRGVFDGTVENMHLHWKYRELVKIMVERKSLAQVNHIAISLEAESGGVLVSVEKTSRGHAIILYRGKNYQRPSTFKAKNLLSKRQALARSIELQRREALKHHVTGLQAKIKQLKSELEVLKTIDEIDEATLYSRIDNASDDDEDDNGNDIFE